MKVYHFRRKQFLPLSLNEAWQFFSSPHNLSKITPARLGFNITHVSEGPESVYAGQIISYKINVFPFVRTTWVTEITHVSAPYYFVDEQRFGPYAMWHHQHFFREVTGGVEMTDEVTYAIPFGLLGRLAQVLFVQRQLKTIFDYRYELLEKLFVKPGLMYKSA